MTARRSNPLLHILLAILVALLLAACASSVDQAALDDAVATAAASDVIPGRFIVTVRDGVDPASVATAYGLRPDFTYRTAITGFAGAISEAARAGLMRDARVLSIEPDRVMYAIATQSNATWGLDRIDQRALPLSTTFSYTNTGSGVRAYIIDTGILSNHAEFGSRVVGGYTAISDGRGTTDCNGHGTHVAGTVGGTNYGVAKSVTLVAVRVLGCNGSGTTSGVIAGVDWVTANTYRPAVANMSLGGGASTSLDTAVKNSINSGITYAVAAGNGDWRGRQQDACKYSPARVPEALTIGATDKTDTKASWSNYGNCVDFFAPGVGITSAWYTSTTATNTISGTSMATPHVAGVAALYLQSNTAATPAQVSQALYDLTSKGYVKKSSTTKNHLLFTSY